MVMLQAERAQHDQLAISIKGLEDRYKSKTELCKKLEERATTKAAACKELQQQLQAAAQQKDILAGQLSVLQVTLYFSYHRIQAIQAIQAYQDCKVSSQ